MLRWGAILFFSVLVRASCCLDLRFPPGFRFGAATAAFQIEGGWNASGKSPSVWDTLTHERPELMTDRSSGDVACNSYVMWERDIEIAQELGLQFYRFSIAWSRLLPTGFPDEVNADGVRYYGELIDGLLRAGVEPVVTLYHWDLPQSLQDLGGWTNPLVTDWFADYSRVVYSLFGDRVKTWVTINEPMISCTAGYGGYGHAPAMNYPELAVYMCAKNAIVAHAKAYRVYDEEFRAEQNGKVSLANHVLWFEPASADDVELAELLNQYGLGVYAHPIFSAEGGWPAAVEARVADNSRREGYTRSRLPAFTREEVEMVRGTFDYFALNHYTSRLVRLARPGERVPLFPFSGCPELDTVFETGADWSQNEATAWFYEHPEGFRQTLNWIKQHYGDVEILITENGYATAAAAAGGGGGGGGGDDANDDARIAYYRDHLEQVLLAIQEDGVNVSGYTAWSLIDNFEWTDGYTSKFGLYAVDFSSPARARAARKSARYYASVVRARSLDVPLLRDEL